MTDRDSPELAGAPDDPGLKLRLEEKLGVLDELRLVPFRGHGTRNSLHVKGRLIEAKGTGGTIVHDEGEEDAERGDDGDGLLHNVLTTLRRMESDEIPGALLRARFRDREHELYTDGEGYFQLNLYLEDGGLEAGWHGVEVELVDSLKEGARASATVEALVPSEHAEFAVVSDLDDTVIRSSASNKMTQLKMTLMKDAASRTPFQGVGAHLRRRGVPTLRGQHTVAFAEHMVSERLISEEALGDIRNSVEDPRRSDQVV